MPTNVVALVMKALPGTELACRTANYRFMVNGQQLDRGVISYYATQALTETTTMESWLHLIEARCNSDLREGLLPRLYGPSLQILGDPASRLPGHSIPTRTVMPRAEEDKDKEDIPH